MKYVLASTIPLLALVCYMSFEARWLKVTVFEVRANVRIPLKIAHLSDLHIHRFGSLEQGVLNSLDREKPDLIVITGDTFDGPESLAVGPQILSKMKAPLGVFAVNGNWEHWLSENTAPYFEQSGIHLLKNERFRVREDIDLAGSDLGQQHSRILSSEGDPTRYCISLYHYPINFDQDEKCPLALAGHTHGGQVRLPFVGPIWKPYGSGRYDKGWYGDPQHQLFVSAGIGTSILPIRFLNRPELVYMVLHK
ncbi:MAG: metallophosphoesterase [Deltaproteobacteria bacterium]|nr:metallophosphoesterase [Deltaproteobacteria bacterium]MBI3294846.1 metallophosphoesterase [Deltaproteobacteria bacterium]